MLGIHVPTGGSSPRQLYMVWLWQVLLILAHSFCSWIMGFTVCYLRLCSLGTHTCPVPGAVVTLVLPVDPAIVLCRLSCPDPKISGWCMASCSP